MRRPLLLLLLLSLLYFLAGELVHAWVRLHLDTWQSGETFGNERQRREWQRAIAVVDWADGPWAWKVSLHRDAARLHLFGVRGRFEADHVGAAAILAAADRADRWSSENAATQMLRARAYILLGDADSLRRVSARVHALAPNESGHQEPLLMMTVRRAVLVPGLQPVARELAARYAARDPGGFEQLCRKSFILRKFADCPRPP